MYTMNESCFYKTIKVINCKVSSFPNKGSDAEVADSNGDKVEE